VIRKTKNEKKNIYKLTEMPLLFCLFVSFLGELTITPADVRWVGAWWLGILICALVNFLAGLPFWFLPRSLVKEGEISESEKTGKKEGVLLEGNEQKETKQSMYEIAKGKLYQILFFLSFVLKV